MEEMVGGSREQVRRMGGKLVVTVWTNRLPIFEVSLYFCIIRPREAPEARATMIRLVAALLLVAGLASALSARPAGTSPDPKDLAIPANEIARARELIKRLGSEVYKEREEAQAELAKMGRLARSVLAEAATSDSDPEVRYRCARLLPKAGADELRARLETFLADTTNKYEHDLPGLKQ